MREPTTAASARLDALPRKVSAPLRELLAAGQIDEEILGTVLDAAELAGSPMKVLGFAVGFLYLQLQRVPVKDVIRMARAQRRRIRLDWSARRWQEEHDRLSRAETLKRLREENVHYDLAEATASLPAHFCGYLIRSSRRLGMEGLRQRHCVAGYHAQVQAGYCAIASVFIDRERWTVQLARTGDEEAPVRIVQIRSRFNKVPTREVREAIHRELAIPMELRGGAQDVDPDEARPHAYMDNLRRILPVLRESGVRRVTVSFDGSGDSGSIDDIEYGDAAIDASTLMVEIEVIHRVLQGGQWVTNRVLEHKDLNTAIEELTDDYLGETNVDWYNNDGGFGELTIDVDEGTVALEVSVRFIESSTEYSCTRDIVTGEETDA